jgi:hypothetical protein
MTADLEDHDGQSQHGNQPIAFLSYPLNVNEVLAPLILCIGHVPSRNTSENLAEKPDYTLAALSTPYLGSQLGYVPFDCLSTR